MADHIEKSLKKRIIGIRCEPARGPGWSNTPMWIIYRHDSGRVEEVCIQPEKQTPKMRLLYPIAACVHAQLVAAVQEDP